MPETYHQVKARRLRNLELTRQGINISLTPAGPIILRLNELRALGWSFDAIAAWNGGGTAAAIQRIHAGRSATVERKFAPIADLPLTVAVPPHMPGNVHVPSLGCRRRVQALLRLGWHHTDITAAAGVTSYSFSKTRGGYRRIRAEDWRTIDAAFESMSAHLGPSAITRRRAEARGFPAPLAWDDIDDPAEQPRLHGETGSFVDDTPDEAVVVRVLSGEWRLPATMPERVEVFRRFQGTQSELERLTGWNITRIVDAIREAAA